MTIKDFTPGQVVFVTERIRAARPKYQVKRMIVKTIGRKYVKASAEGSSCVDEFYHEKESDNYLTENNDWGEPALLFTTEEALSDFFEKEKQKLWIIQHVSLSKLDNFSTEQLLEIRKIMERKER